jgi:BirA family transcriptional regulator, biotin operon repressor / biotin---[acetyl-CoA-carboxylase] ligase
MRAETHTPSPAPVDVPALDAEALRRAVLRPGGLWRALDVTPSTGSTNADLLARARDGAPEGVVLAAEEQSAGRGRMGRSWQSPPRAALTFSLLLRPAPVPPARRGWLPLLAGTAVAGAVRTVAAVDARLKWPNDVLVGEAKLGGILAEAVGDAVIVGVGLNVSAAPSELPETALPATSLRALGAASLAREPLLAGILAEFERWYLAWREAGGDPDHCGLRAGYTKLSATIGRRVRVEMPGGQLLSGLAAGVDEDGRLLVRSEPGEGPGEGPGGGPGEGPGEELAVVAGDVVHLR